MKEERARATVHCERTKANKMTFKHNDQGRESHENVDPDRVKLNRYWRLFPDTKNIEENEKAFWACNFSKGLEAQNQRHIANRHPDRVKTMDEFITSTGRPWEALLYLGDLDHAPDPDTLWQAGGRLVKEFHASHPNWMPLDMALHCDEKGAPHLHIRYVFIGHDELGNAVPSQTKALREMGYAKASRREGAKRRDNANLDFTEEMRETFQNIGRKLGIDLETEPREKSRSGQTLLDYQVGKAQERLAEAEAAVTDLRGEKAQLVEALAVSEANLADATSRLSSLTEALSAKETLLADATNELEALKVQTNEQREMAYAAVSQATRAADNLQDLKAQVKEMTETRDGLGEEIREKTRVLDKMASWFDELGEAWNNSWRAFKRCLEQAPQEFQRIARNALAAGEPWADYVDALPAKETVDEFFSMADLGMFTGGSESLSEGFSAPDRGNVRWDR